MASDNNRYELTRGQRLLSSLLYALCRMVAILPRWVRYYVIEDIIFVVLRYVVRYRRGVIMTNLRNSFPERDERELENIAHRYYRYLAEQFLNTLSVTGATPEQMRRFLRFPEAEAYIEATKGRDVILMGGHYGCWEYMSAMGAHDDGHYLMSIYHPLENSALDDLFKRMRALENTDLVPRDDSLRYFIKNRGGRGESGKPLAMGLIADQNPTRHKDSHWFRFLNQDTIFAEGGEQLARKLRVPVWYVGMRYLRRGEYEMYAEQIFDGEEQTEEMEITERYIRALERDICAVPHLWLWSHRRWKHKKEE